MKPPAVVRTAAGQTRNRAFDSPDARKIEKTIRAFVNESSRPCAGGEGEIVAALFVADPQIMASRPPLVSMRQDVASTDTKLSEEMRELVTKCPFDFHGILLQAWIQRNQSPAIIRAAGACLQTRIPFHANFFRDAGGAECSQEFARPARKIDVLLVAAPLCEARRVPQGRGYSRCRPCKRKFQLLKQPRMCCFSFL